LWAAWPWLWLAVVGVVLLLATGTIGRHRPTQDQ
jgi:hypothetical protein